MYLFASVLGLVEDSKSSKMRPSSFSFFQSSCEPCTGNFAGDQAAVLQDDPSERRGLPLLVSVLYWGGSARLPHNPLAPRHGLASARSRVPDLWRQKPMRFTPSKDPGRPGRTLRVQRCGPGSRPAPVRSLAARQFRRHELGNPTSSSSTSSASSWKRAMAARPRSCSTEAAHENGSLTQRSHAVGR